VTRWAAAGLLPCMRTPSGERRYRRCDVEELLNRPGVGQPGHIYNSGRGEFTNDS
jgi:predicted site-specific integrase-resolvase